MKWNDLLSTLAEEKKITSQAKETIEELPSLIELVFLPDYAKEGYLIVEPDVKLYYEQQFFFMECSLISVNANRRLGLNYGFHWQSNVEGIGNFSDNICILNEKKSWGSEINIEVFAKKHFGVTLDKNYRLLRHYHGSLQTKITSCLKVIKQYYDTYAFDIITGKRWDRNAWKDLREPDEN